MNAQDGAIRGRGVRIKHALGERTTKLRKAKESLRQKHVWDGACFGRRSRAFAPAKTESFPLNSRSTDSKYPGSGCDQSLRGRSHLASEVLSAGRRPVGCGACCALAETGLFSLNGRSTDLIFLGSGLACGMRSVLHRWVVLASEVWV